MALRTGSLLKRPASIVGPRVSETFYSQNIRSILDGTCCEKFKGQVIITIYK